MEIRKWIKNTQNYAISRTVRFEIKKNNNKQYKYVAHCLNSVIMKSLSWLMRSCFKAWIIDRHTTEEFLIPKGIDRCGISFCYFYFSLFFVFKASARRLCQKPEKNERHCLPESYANQERYSFIWLFLINLLENKASARRLVKEIHDILQRDLLKPDF